MFIQRFQSFFELCTDAVYSMDRQGRLIDVNPAFKSLTGYTKDELFAMTFHLLVDPDYLEMTMQHFRQALEGSPQYYETVGIHKNGRRIPVHVMNVPIIEDGEILGVYGVAKDLTKEKETLLRLEVNEEKYRSLFEYNLDAIVETDLEGRYRNANLMAGQLTGYSKEELLGKPFTDFIADDLKKVMEEFSQVVQGRALQVEMRIRRKNGDLAEIDVMAVPIRRQGNVEGVFAIARDVTEKKHFQTIIKELAYTDQLTGLSNRHWFYQELARVVKRSGEREQGFAILWIDFDNFKNVNDTFGHKAGDLFLQHVAERLKSRLRQGDSISRVGGDEFIMVLERADEEEARRFAEKLLQDMTAPIHILDRPMVVTMSIGISLSASGAPDDEAVVQQADLALFAAKKLGKNNCQFFSREISEKLQRRRLMEYALRQAVEQGEFELHYQPQVDLASGKVTGLEALIRWHSADGLVSPLEFIPIAEETGLILPIGRWVIAEACRQIKKWEEQGFLPMKVSVNVSARQFTDSNFAGTVRKILEEENVDPSRLEIEITESIMLNVEQSLRYIQALRELGVTVAIDDFGIGYSSLNVIKNVEIDTLKIDKSFVDGALVNDRMLAVLKAIIQVGKELDTQVIVEGIETKEQRELLKGFGVIGQGYFFSRPLPSGELQATLRDSF